MTTLNPQGLCRMKQLLPLLGISRTTLYNWCQTGKFPKPMRLSHNVTVWRAADVIAWIEAQGAQA